MPVLPQVGPTELLIILFIILLFFGAKRIPELTRSLGKGTREFRKGISEGASEDEAQEENRKEKDAEKPPLEDAVATNDKWPRAEAEAAPVKQKP